MSDESGQALAEYTLVTLGLLSLVLVTRSVTNLLYDDAFDNLLRGFWMYADMYDLMLSLPFP